jgi:hypothetical protein
MSADTAGMKADAAVRPFHLDMAEEAVADLRQRIAAWRPPEREPVHDQSQGVQLVTVRDLANYWATEYDWRRCEAKLNALPQFMTEIDGGWPGSVIEQLKIIEPLTNPAEHGGSAPDAFDVVIPSLPGYGFSGKPAATGWDPIASHAPGRADATTRICPLRHPRRRLGHRDLGRDGAPGARRAARHPRQLRRCFRPASSVTSATATPPADTPVGLAAWLLDHDETTYKHLAHLFAGHSYGAITRDDWLDNGSLYWLTNTATSAARLYWQQAVTGKNFYAAANVSLPAAVTVFPEEYVTAPRSWTEAERGGHFAAWEQPQLLSRRAARGVPHTALNGARGHNPAGAPSLAHPAPISTRFRGSAL